MRGSEHSHGTVSSAKAEVKQLRAFRRMMLLIQQSQKFWIQALRAFVRTTLNSTKAHMQR
jgi:hypothetical protein